MKKIAGIIIIPLMLLSCSYGGSMWDGVQAKIDSTGPALVSSDPADESVNVGYATLVTLVFDENVNPETVTAETVVVTQDGSVVAGTFTVDGSSVTFMPSGFFTRGAAHPVTMVIKQGITDIYDNPLAADITQTFSVLENPTVISISPATGSTSSVNVLHLTFSEPIKITGPAFSVSITTYAGTVSFDSGWDGTGDLTVTLSTVLIGGVYEITLTGFTGLDGAPVSNNIITGYTVN